MKIRSPRGAGSSRGGKAFFLSASRCLRPALAILAAVSMTLSFWLLLQFVTDAPDPDAFEGAHEGEHKRPRPQRTRRWRALPLADSKSGEPISYALLYPNPDCSGDDDDAANFIRINSTEKENKCRGCRDLCHLKFPGEDKTANDRPSGSVSVRLVGNGHHQLILFTRCLGTYGCPDEDKDGCVRAIIRPTKKANNPKNDGWGECRTLPDVSFDHVKFVPAEEQTSYEEGVKKISKIKGLLPEEITDSDAGWSFAMLYPNEYCKEETGDGSGGQVRLKLSDDGSGRPVRINYAEGLNRYDGLGTGPLSCQHCRELCDVRFPYSEDLLSIAERRPKSLRVYGWYQLDLHRPCLNKLLVDRVLGKTNSTGYIGTVRREDRCVNLEQIATDGILGHVRFVERDPYGSGDPPNYMYLDDDEIDEDGNPNPNKKVVPPPGEYHVVFAAEDTAYSAWQSKTLYQSFKKSQKNLTAAKFTRMLLADEPDDLMEDEGFFTLQAPRHPYSKSYRPYNIPDSIDKWYNSRHPPREDVLVVLSADSYLLRDLTPHVRRVRKYRPLAQSAPYSKDDDIRGAVDRLWKRVCELRCEKTYGGKPTVLDHVTVPIFIHRLDLKEVTYVWSYYTMKLRWWKEKGKLSSDFDESLYGMIDESAEMIAYVFASAHCGLTHVVEENLRIRDDPSKRNDGEYLGEVPMLYDYKRNDKSEF